MTNSSFQFSISSDGYFIIPAADGENIRLKYVTLVSRILSIVIILASSALICITMALTAKLRTAVDIVFSQVIISSVIMAVVNSVYQSYLSWRVGSRQSMVFCLFMSSLGMANYTVALTTYLFVAIMQLVVVKKGVRAFGKVFTRRVACMTSASIWIASIGTSGCLVAGHYGNGSVYIFDPAIQACHSHILNSTLLNRPFSLCVMLLTFFSITGTSICYVITMQALRSQVAPNPEPKSTPRKTNTGIEQLSLKTRQRLVSSTKRIIVLMLIYMLSFLPAGVISGLSAVSQMGQRYVYQQVAIMVSMLGAAAYFPVYIVSHRLRRRACYLLLTGRYKDISYSI